MEHALPRRTAGIPRTWSLCMTSESHGTVGPAGCKFSHAPDKHERVLVVEVPTAAGAPADQINIRLVGARQDLPVAEFEGYVDGEPLVRWMDRDNMPRVGTKLFVEPVAAQASPVALPPKTIDTPEFRELLAKAMDAADLATRTGDPHRDYKPARDALVAHIDAAIQASTSGERQEGGAA